MENYRLLFANLDELPTLKTEMVEFGYNDEKIAESNKLYKDTLALYTQNEPPKKGRPTPSFLLFTKPLKKDYAKYRKIEKVALEPERASDDFSTAIF